MAQTAMERGSLNSGFDNAQWKLAEHAVWANTWEQEAAHGCPKGQRSRFEGGPVTFISLRRKSALDLLTRPAWILSRDVT
jgi:hypothetical protein